MTDTQTPRLPTVIASSVVRSAHQGESHGGVYIVDMEDGTVNQVIDWNDTSINWAGRGADRGLRGIAIHGDRVYLAASDELFMYDHNFNIIGSFRNRYLKHTHEIFIADDILYLTSTGFDSVLLFNLAKGTFDRGYCLRFSPTEQRLYFNIFDPSHERGPPLGDTIHLNNVYQDNGRLFVGSLNIPSLLCITDDKVFPFAPIPVGSHNARPFQGGILLNDTLAERITYLDNTGTLLNSLPVIHYCDDELTMNHLPKDHARQAFARGLCVSDNGWILGGSSPSTVSAYRLDSQTIFKTINLTMDIRNSIHGLTIWPF